MNYYVSKFGDDLGDGSIFSPWKSLDKISNFSFMPGDVIRIQGGLYSGYIDWFYKGIGDSYNEIVIDSYDGFPTIYSPEDLPAFSYAGLGGIKVNNIIFKGKCTKSGINGINVSNLDISCSNIKFNNLDISNYTLGGIGITGYVNNLINLVRIKDCNLHDNANGTHIQGVYDLKIKHTKAIRNDWVGIGGAQIGGYGIGVYGCKNVLIAFCDANYNGLLTTEAGGHGGIIGQDCDDLIIKNNQALGNGDPTGNDGTGLAFYGCMNSKMQNNFSANNLNGGLSLYNDAYARENRDCIINNNISFNDIIGIAIVGSSFDSYIRDNNVVVDCFDGKFRKAVDIAKNLEGTNERRISFYNNKITTINGALALEASSLKDIFGLEINSWNGNGKYRVLDLDYLSILDAIKSEVI